MRTQCGGGLGVIWLTQPTAHSVLILHSGRLESSSRPTIALPYNSKSIRSSLQMTETQSSSTARHPFPEWHVRRALRVEEPATRVCATSAWPNCGATQMQLTTFAAAFGRRLHCDSESASQPGRQPAHDRRLPST